MALDSSTLHQQHLFALNNTLLLDTWSTPSTFLDDIIISQNYENNNSNVSYDYNVISNINNDGIIFTNNYDNIYNNVGFSTLNEYEWGLDSSPEVAKSEGDHGNPNEVVMRPRRRRATAKKNKMDIENQRMTHIAVERNRRKQMNEYLNMLRSLMPDSYVQRGDQASIVGGAINFVKELEHNLHYLSAKKHIMENLSKDLPFQEFFTFPQYSTSGHSPDNNNDQMNLVGAISQPIGGGGDGAEAEVEVTMVESHANLKIRMKQQAKQLSKIVSGLLCLRFTILHLNVNTAEGLVFYSFNLKVEDDSKMSTVDEIAGAVYNLLCRIQEDQVSHIC